MMRGIVIGMRDRDCDRDCDRDGRLDLECAGMR